MIRFGKKSMKYNQSPKPVLIVEKLGIKDN